MVESRDQTRAVGDCLLFSTADWDEPYWTNKQHTARILANRGWRVLYVESVGFRSPKLASGKDWARIWRRLWRGLRSNLIGPERREANIWVLSPLMIPAKHHWPIVREINQALLKSSIARFVRKHRYAKPVAWTYHPYMLAAIEGLARSRLVYHCVDDIAAIPGVDVEAFEQAERRLLCLSDVVFTTAPALYERCSRLNRNTHFFANVADADHFGRALKAGSLPADLAAIPGPRLVYHGVLSDFKVDFPLMLAAARMRPEWQWIFIGNEREGQRSEFVSELKQMPNVHFLGYKTYEQLPEYLRGMSVGLLPTQLNDYTRSMFPMKFFEYLAAGLPVVSTPLDFTRSQTAGLEVAATPEAFVQAVERQLRRGKLTPDEAVALVGDNTWDARTVKMLGYVWPESGRQGTLQPASAH